MQDFKNEIKTNSKARKFLSVPYEIWPSHRIKELLANKYIVFMGDSIQRCAYKDLVTLLQKNNLCEDKNFRFTAEPSHEGDHQVDISNEKKNSFDFFQIRTYYHAKSNTRVSFYFITKIWSAYVKQIFENDFKNKKPDFIVANSMLYDISNHHYGASAQNKYIKNLEIFHKICKYNDIHLLWRSSLPLGKNAKGGFLKPHKDYQTAIGTVSQVRGDIVLYNGKVREYCLKNGLEILDAHDHFIMILDERDQDDIHWSPFAHRILSFMTLSLIRRIFGVPKIPWAFLTSLFHSQEEKNKAIQVLENYENYYDYQGEKYFKNCSIETMNGTV